MWTNLQNFPIHVIRALYIDVSLYLTLTIQAWSRLKRSANHLWNSSDVCRKKFGEWSPLDYVNFSMWWNINKFLVYGECHIHNKHQLLGVVIGVPCCNAFFLTLSIYPVPSHDLHFQHQMVLPPFLCSVSSDWYWWNCWPLLF